MSLRSSNEIICHNICKHRPVALLVERWEPGLETLRRSIYETPDWDGPVGGSSRGQLTSVEWGGPCPALMGMLNFRF